ncbi:MAG: PAS domain-containing sensor histidine kinase [Nitriliruptorales bacterium]|nr:PAS domain-containing sensor histidine kinase [Nitriliruptorales bacterium]
MSGEDAPDLAAVEVVIAALPDAVCVLDLDGEIRAANGRFRRELGEGGLRELVDDPGSLEAAIGLWSSSGSPKPTVLTVDGRRWRCDGARLRRGGGILVRWQAHTEAVEAFRATAKTVQFEALERAREQLRSALKELEATNAALRASNDELERFASAVSHDLQTPMMVISATAEILVEELEDDEHGELAQTIVRNARRLQSQIQGVLEVARAGSDGGVEEPVSVPDVLVDVESLLRDVIRESGAEVDTAGEVPSLPLSRPEAVQLLQNLVHNAVKFGAHEGTPTVRISGRHVDGSVELTVEDDGPGIPEGEEERVFDLFHRADRDQGGTGIGLATCRRIVERHGGRIWIETSELGGAAVRFRLPVLASSGGDEQGL